MRRQPLIDSLGKGSNKDLRLEVKFSGDFAGFNITPQYTSNTMRTARDPKTGLINLRQTATSRETFLLKASDAGADT